jgi:hypothetical protein
VTDDASSDNAAVDPSTTTAKIGDADASLAGPAQPPAALSAPAITSAGSSSATVTTSPGNVGLQLHGGTELGSYAIAVYAVGPGLNSATATFTVNPTADVSFVYTLLGSGTRYSTQQLRLQRIPNSNVLQAAASSGSVACGTLASDRPTAVTLAFDGATKTFDVLLAGEASACMHLPTTVVAPITGFDMMDASNEGWGGQVDFTNLALF